MRVLGMADGLSQASVRALLQDSDGFLWIGTQGGLNRYDGHRFKVYRALGDAAAGLRDDYVESLLEDSGGHLWVGTNRGGLARMGTQEGRFDVFPLSELGPWQPSGIESAAGRTGVGRSVWAVAEDLGGRLILATDVGPVSFDVRSSVATRLPSIESSGTRALVLLGDELWTGSTAGSVIRYERASGSTWRPVLRAALEGGVWSMAMDEDGQLWVGTDGGVAVLRPRDLSPVADHTILTVPDLGSVLHISAEDSGRIWLGSTEGLLVYETSLDRVSRMRFDPTNPRGLPDAEVRSVLTDRGGTLWIGTWGGLASLPRLHAAFAQIPTEAEQPGGLRRGAVAMAPAGEGALWVGTMGGGVNRLDLGSGEVEVYLANPEDPSRPTSNTIFDLSPASTGAVWVATYGGGVNRIVGAGARFERFSLASTQPGVQELNAGSVFVDRSGRVYAGTPEAGLQQLVPGTTQFAPARGPNGDWDFGSEYVWPMAESADGFLWVGAHGGGLSRIDPTRTSVQRWSSRDGLSDDRILTLLVDPGGAVWIGTEGGGLNHFEPTSGVFTAWTTAQGLPHNNVEGLLQDDRGYLWISTNDGLARFDPVAEDFWVFREPAGLAGNRFYANAAYESSDGLLFFGGEAGLTVVAPALVERKELPPPAALTGLWINEEEVPVELALGGEGLELEYEQRFFRFSFAALDFADPRQNRYQYRLHPLQRDWVDAGNDNVATYTSVPPNRYTFLVRARNAEGVWNEAALSVPVWVATPWWQTWWFRSSVLAAVAVAVSALFAYRIQQIRSREALRLDFATRLHNDIGANVSAMFYKAEMSATADAEKRQRYLADISRLAGDTADKLRETVWVADTKYDTLAGVVSKLRDTADVMLGGAIDVTFSAPDRLPARTVGMQARKDLYELYKEILQNTLRHSGAGRVQIDIRFESDDLELVVRDDGKGFDTSDEARGSGLALMRACAAKHKGRLEVLSTPGMGTTVSMRMRMK